MQATATGTAATFSPPIPKSVSIKTRIVHLATGNVYNARFIYRTQTQTFSMAAYGRGYGCVGIYYLGERADDERHFVERDRTVKRSFGLEPLHFEAGPGVTIPEADWQRLRAAIERKTGIADFA